jgi:predicted regulator of Ras-like GTPase activity (Roadblock/LC7/MglB family)
MDAAQALADLTEISAQIDAAVVVDGDGKVAGSTLEDAERAERMAGAARRLLEEADGVVGAREGTPLVQLQAATPVGCVFVVREGGRTIAAVAGADPTVGLVFYDLKSCLRSLGEPEQAKPKQTKPRRKPAAKKTKKKDDGAA